MPRDNLSGRRFGRLVVDAHVDTRANGHIVWLCRCDCGNETRVTACSLKRGHSASCGCLQREARIRHGHGARVNRTPTYRSWQSMIARCTRPTSSEWSYYGGRGIVVCHPWRTFDNFLADMGPRPTGTSIDRIDSNGNYEPGNCRWATRAEQSRNTRRTILTAELVEDLRALWASGVSYDDLATQFGISVSHARNVAHGRTWKRAADLADADLPTKDRP
jgi:hypothetical protein